MNERHVGGIIQVVDVLRPRKNQMSLRRILDRLESAS